MGTKNYEPKLVANRLMSHDCKGTFVFLLRFPYLLLQGKFRITDVKTYGA